MPNLYAPDGTRITATVDTLTAFAAIEGAKRLSDGSIDIHYAGESDVDWDSQKTVVRNGQRVFMDADGNEHLENTLLLLTEEEWEERFGEDAEDEDEECNA